MNYIARLALNGCYLRGPSGNCSYAPQLAHGNNSADYAIRLA